MSSPPSRAVGNCWRDSAPHRPRPLRPLVEGVHAREVKAVYDNLGAFAEEHFTVGINDDVAHTAWSTTAVRDRGRGGRRLRVLRLGADAPSGEQDSIKIIGEETAATRRATGLRLEESGSKRCRTCGSGPADSLAYLVRVPASSPVISSRSSSRSNAARGDRGGGVLLNSPFGPTGSGTSCRAGCRRT